jgi:hypothetical protein
MLNRILESRDQSLIFSEVVGLVTQIFAEGRDFLAGFAHQDYAVAGGSWVTAGAAVAEGD